MPYSAIIQAFEQLAQKLLTETTTRVEQGRAVLLEALGGNAQVILDVIPGLEQLLGEPDKVIELGPSESQYRFNLMFRRFVRALATEDHPLVIFLDDLQWADGASLALLQVLMSDPDLANLTLIGTRRSYPSTLNTCTSSRKLSERPRTRWTTRSAWSSGPVRMASSLLTRRFGSRVPFPARWAFS